MLDNKEKLSLHKKYIRRFKNIKQLKLIYNIKLAVFLKKNFSNFFYSIILNNFEVYIYLNLKYFILFIKIIKNNTIMLYEQLLDILSIDNLEIKNFYHRFCILYSFLSIKNNQRIFLKIFPIKYIKNFESILLYKSESLLNFYNSAGWLERENWDMFGIIFEGNFDLRRILTDYSFEGFPLRKDFPLSGFFDLSFNIYEKRIMLNKIEFIQDFRVLEFRKSWK